MRMTGALLRLFAVLLLWLLVLIYLLGASSYLPAWAVNWFPLRCCMFLSLGSWVCTKAAKTTDEGPRGEERQRHSRRELSRVSKGRYCGGEGTHGGEDAECRELSCRGRGGTEAVCVYYFDRTPPL